MGARLLAVFLSCGVVVALGGQPSSRDVFERARMLEESHNRLTDAIVLYAQVASEANDRQLAATAQLRIGLLHERLGQKAEAQRAFRAVVERYADQPELARQALARVTPPASAAANIVVRQVWSGTKVSFTGTVSADGRHLSFVDGLTGNLHLLDLATGRDRPLTTDGTWYQRPIQFADQSTISPDGRHVSYGWIKGGRCELRLVATSGSAAPRVLVSDETIASIQPFSWSPDGRTIAVQFRRTDCSAHIGLVTVSDGSLRVLRSGTTTSMRLFFSPDGAQLAFDLPSAANTRERDVFVLAVTEGKEIPAVVHPGNDFAAGWSPDGRALLFASDRGGTRGLWHRRWANGQPAGEPALIKNDVGMAAPPLGITRSGALYYGTAPTRRDVVVAGIDIDTGAVVSPPMRPITRFVGANSSPDWSPDGRSLVYISGGQGAVLGVRSMDTGEIRELRPRLARINSPRWAPDGASLAVIGSDVEGRYGFYRVDAQTGETSLIREVPQRFAPYMHDWTPDGRSLVYRISQDEGTVAVRLDVNSGETLEIKRGELATMRLSPDGRRLASAGRDGISVMSLDTGESRTVPTGLEWPMMLMAWTPDSRKVLIWRAESDAPRARGELWLVSVDDGRRVKLDLDLEVGGPPGARFNPKTNQLALTLDETRNEIWVLENFLPARKGS